MSRKQIKGEKKLKETTIKYEYLKEEEVLRVRITGTLRQDPSLELVKQIKGEMEIHDCRKSLIDLRNGELIVNITTTYYRPHQFIELDISHKNRVAFVVNTINTNLRFFENVFANKGYYLFVFDDYKKAMAWLKK